MSNSRDNKQLKNTLHRTDSHGKQKMIFSSIQLILGFASSPGGISLKMRVVALIQRIELAAMIILLLAPSLIFAQRKPAPTLPDTQAGKRVARWIVAFKTGVDDKMLQWYTENLSKEALNRRPLEEWLGMSRDMHDYFGTLEPKKVVTAEENLVTVVFAIKDGFVKLSFEFENQPPHRLLRIFGDRTDDPDLPPPPEVNESEAVKAIEKAA